ncbi:MAG: Nif3-like dinuclear metal center hexameric protein [Magnetococcales bacterium]|nr:Nif3-like dinuclear metal center hexameric protein [Magnetococcales bacterium]
MVTLGDVESFLNETLHPESFRDYAPNGVQVQGREEINRVVTGVSACVELFQKAVDLGAELVLVHHGLFWDKEPRVVEGSLKQRLKILLQQDMTLMAYHLPLDAHPEWGNNACILRKLALEPLEPFGLYNGTALSWVGRCSPPRTVAEMFHGVTDLFGGSPLLLNFGPERIERVAVCSGAAPELVRQARAAGADLFLTGEATESVYHYCQEEGLHFIAAGHHRTETFGVQALGKLLTRRFGLDHHFVDLANPL